MRPSVSIIIPAKYAAECLLANVPAVHSYMETRYADSFEIIIVPNGDASAAHQDATHLAAHELSKAFSKVRVCHHIEPKGKGAALRSGFAVAKGSHIIFTDADLPFGIEVFASAIENLKRGSDLVSANRRLPQSRFLLHTPTLGLAWRRHLIGISVNWIIRLLFRLDTKDTQSGFKAVSRRLAEKTFAKQLCPGFLFDIEIFLIAQKNHYKREEMPVVLNLRNEKSTVRVMREVLSSVYWLTIIFGSYLRGHFDAEKTATPLPIELSTNAKFTADDWGISPGVNEGILELANDGVIKRVSIIADGAFVDYKLDELKAVPGLEFGLHFNITHGPRFLTVQRQMLQCFVMAWRPAARRHDWERELRRIFSEQLAKLSTLKIHVSYLDGHHHSHLFPGVLKALSSRIQQSDIKTVRIIGDRSLWSTPKVLLLILSIFARRQAHAINLKTLPCLYPSPPTLSSKDVQTKLQFAEGPHEIIVHPASRGDTLAMKVPDSYCGARVQEFISLKLYADNAFASAKLDSNAQFNLRHESNAGSII